MGFNIVSSGSYLPTNQWSDREMDRFLKLAPGTCRNKFDVEYRHVANTKETAIYMAVQAPIWKACGTAAKRPGRPGPDPCQIRFCPPCPCLAPFTTGRIHMKISAAVSAVCPVLRCWRRPGSTAPGCRATCLEPPPGAPCAACMTAVLVHCIEI